MDFGLYLRKFAAIYLGCFSCCLLRLHAHVPAVAASAAVGLAGTFLPFPERFDRKSIQAAIYAGSFVGMSAPELLSAHAYILLASAVGAIVYVLARPHFNGFGGRLGAIALVSSLALLLIRTVVP